ncbi:MAG TPA: hypothetical protein VFS43_39490 [Polyangiaceae bacterium]|nr:hypothetical protein [Polyangiaceae bacterium]
METHRTNTVSVRVDDQEIVHVVGDPDSTQTLADALQNVGLVTRLVGTARRPVLIDMRAVKYIERDARAYYASEEGAMNAPAVAVVVDSQVTRMLANLVLSMVRSGTPRRLFTDLSSARGWLNRIRKAPPGASGPNPTAGA